MLICLRFQSGAIHIAIKRQENGALGRLCIQFDGICWFHFGYCKARADGHLRRLGAGNPYMLRICVRAGVCSRGRAGFASGKANLEKFLLAGTVGRNDRRIMGFLLQSDQVRECVHWDCS
jgi:hypothetical protein